MGDDVKLNIDGVKEDGEPIAPPKHASKFIRQCGVIVRDNLDIRIQEWHKQKDETIPYVQDRMKKMLWAKLKVNFTLPPEEAAEKDPEEHPKDTP